LFVCQVVAGAAVSSIATPATPSAKKALGAASVFAVADQPIVCRVPGIQVRTNEADGQHAHQRERTHWAEGYINLAACT
jgi:hypothetical protein